MNRIAELYKLLVLLYNEIEIKEKYEYFYKSELKNLRNEYKTVKADYEILQEKRKNKTRVNIKC